MSSPECFNNAPSLRSTRATASAVRATIQKAKPKATIKRTRVNPLANAAIVSGIEHALLSPPPPPNDPAQQPAGPSELHVGESLHAPPVCCSAWFGVWRSQVLDRMPTLNAA